MLPVATQTVAYEANLTASGGTSPYSWEKVSGPSWISIADNGKLTGTPPSVGTVYFVARVSDATGHAVSTALSIEVKAVVGSFAPLQHWSADDYSAGASPIEAGGITSDGQLFSSYTGGYGTVVQGTTHRASKSTAFQLNIEAGTSGFPGDGETPTANGLWGYLLEPPVATTDNFGVEGEWVHFGQWMYVPSAFDGKTKTQSNGALKLVRSCYLGVTAATEDLSACQSPEGFAFSNTYDINNAIDANYPGQRGSSSVQLGFPRDQWFWFEYAVLLHSDGAQAVRRVWIDDVLVLELANATVKWYDVSESPAFYSTMEIPNAVPSLPTSTAVLNKLRIFTYWDGHPDTDQTLYTDDLAVANESHQEFTQVDNLGNPIMGSVSFP